MNRNRTIFFGIIGLAVVVTLCVVAANFVSRFLPENSNFSKPANAIEVSIIYAPEEELYMTEVITDFNRAYANGRNPVTNKDLVRNERPIWITGKSGSSGTVAEGIRNAVIAPNNANVERPTIYSPSVRHWLALVNYQTGQRVFDVDGAPATAIAPVVMAIWESRLNAIKAKNPGQEIGWKELTDLFNAPDGWNSYGLPGRKAVFYGHTDPNISSTALSTLMSEFYAARNKARNMPGSANKLTSAEVSDPVVQQEVRNIEKLIKHYSQRTTEFKQYIAQGPDYLDFVALEENDLIFINQGLTAEGKPPEKLVALYPKEGTFVHDHPFAVPNAPWVTQEQRDAAQVLTDYVLSEPVQRKVLAAGFRPANKAVPLACPVCPGNGIDVNQPRTLLPVPDPVVLFELQQSWQLVKKQANLVILVDTSGSMREDNKIGQARDAIRSFIDDQSNKNNVALVEFNTAVRTLVPMGSVESNKDVLNQRVGALTANGNTALHDAVYAAVEQLSKSPDPGRIQAILLLSDGQDTASTKRINDVVKLISDIRRDGKSPILVIPVAYGKDADVNALSAIARASDTKVQSGDVNTIKRLLEIVGSYF